MTVSVSEAEIKGSCMVTSKVVTPVFLSIVTRIRLLKASATLVSSNVKRNGSIFPSFFSGLSLNKDNVHPKALNGADTTVPIHDERWYLSR